MKFRENWTKILIVLLFIGLLSQVTSIYLPLIAAVVLSFILNPLVGYLCRIRLWPTHLYMARGVAVLLAFCCAILLAVVIGTFVLLPFINEFDKFVINLPSLISKIQDISKIIQIHVSSVTVPENLSNMVEQIVSSAAAYSIDLTKRIINAVFSFATRIIELIVVPVLTYYFLKDWQVLKESFVANFAIENREKARRIIDELAAVVSGYIRGQFLVSITIGFTVFCGMYLLGVEYPLVLGLLATLTETIPIIGPIIGAAPAILLAYLGSPSLALKVLIFFIVVHQIENHVIVPNIMGHTIDLHPTTIIISLLIGGQMFGIVGMILAVPVTALLKVLIRHLWDQ